MGDKDLKPFDGISIMTSEMDEIEVGHLLKVNKNLSLTCQDCGSNRFEADALIPARLEVISGKHIAVTRVDYKEVLVNRVLKCAHCDCTDFVTITETQEEDDGQKQSSVG